MILHLGVIDIPYAEPPQKVPKGAKNPKVAPPVKASSSGQTTGDVAEILEAKYHVAEVFFENHQSDVVSAIEKSLAGALEDLMMGAPPRNSPFGTAESAIEDTFRKFLDDKEIEGMGIPGVPTKAALGGVNHRFKAKRGARRPSFIDTGLYQSSFRCWVD